MRLNEFHRAEPALSVAAGVTVEADRGGKLHHRGTMSP